jgi:hypothetical protein
MMTFKLEGLCLKGSCSEAAALKSYTSCCPVTYCLFYTHTAFFAVDSSLAVMMNFKLEGLCLKGSCSEAATTALMAVSKELAAIKVRAVITVVHTVILKYIQ